MLPLGSPEHPPAGCMSQKCSGLMKLLPLVLLTHTHHCSHTLQVEKLARQFGVAEDVAYTCETAGHFWLMHVLSRWERFQVQVKERGTAIAVQVRDVQVLRPTAVGRMAACRGCMPRHWAGPTSPHAARCVHLHGRIRMRTSTPCDVLGWMTSTPQGLLCAPGTSQLQDRKAAIMVLISCLCTQSPAWAQGSIHELI